MTHSQNKPPTNRYLQDSAKPTLNRAVRHEPDWSGKCLACGATPTHPLTGLCGPCTFGEAETVGGNW